MIQDNIIQTILYFSYFSYQPDLDEIHCFLRQKILKGQLKRVLVDLEHQKIVTAKIIREGSVSKKVYTLGEYTIQIKKINIRIKNSIQKIKKIYNFIKLISLFPQIQLVGLTGTVSMLNARKKDDIDVFVITAKNRLYTGRFICIILSSLLRLRRKFGDKNARDKVCLNLFFDLNDLVIIKEKQTEYVAHEVLQMKPLVNKNLTYERFLDANKWVFELFPNTRVSLKNKKEPQQSVFHKVSDIIELLLKSIQLLLINKHKTTEIITDSQLWFFPDDFEKKLLKKAHHIFLK